MPEYDLIIRGGTIYDGSGATPFTGDVAIAGDQIAAVGDLGRASGSQEIHAAGRAVAPGFINMLSHAQQTLIADGRSQSDIRQGVTLEVMGEGASAMGPLNEAMTRERTERQGDIKFAIEWTTLGEYLAYLEARGVSTNVASFVGASVVRIHEIGYQDRPPTPDELSRMRALVRQAMEEGAVGLSSALIYAPDMYASTEELIALCEVVATYDGMYISHIRSEGSRIFEALDEFLSIVRATGVRGEIYHLKLAGPANWGKLDAVIEKIESARAEGLRVSADMYTYPASSTGLTSLIPGWAQEGGHDAMIGRLQNPVTREQVRPEIQAAGGEHILLVAFKNGALKPLIGKRLAEVAASRGRSVEDTVMDLIVEDDSRVGAVFFSMSEDNVRREIALPWVSFGSDGGSLAPEGVFLKSSIHPRAYGTFARLLGKYVREEKVIPLEEAVRRLTSFPAENLRLERRGRLAEGYFADVVVFDPDTIQDHATFENPHRYATGVAHVYVNGVQVLNDGEHTGATPGRFIRGPGAV